MHAARANDIAESQEKEEAKEDRPMPEPQLVEESCEEYHEEEEQDDEYVAVETQNVTHIEHNKAFIMEKKVESVAVQEHKIKASEMRKMKKEFKQKGWGLISGPCDETTNKPSAGVGAMASEQIKLTRPPRITDAFKKAAEAGRAEKFKLELGWRKPLTAYVIYGKTGGWSNAGSGNKDARAMTDNIIDANKGEMGEEHS